MNLSLCTNVLTVIIQELLNKHKDNSKLKVAYEIGKIQTRYNRIALFKGIGSTRELSMHPDVDLGGLAMLIDDYIPYGSFDASSVDKIYLILGRYDLLESNPFKKSSTLIAFIANQYMQRIIKKEKLDW